MKKVISIVILFIFCAGIINAGLPVVDWSALIQRVLHSAQRIGQWKIYINKYKEFHNEFKRYKYALMTVYRGFKDFDSLNDIFLNIDNIDRFLLMVYHDQNKIDTWSDIFNESKTLEDKYKGIEDNEYIKKNKLYQNPYLKISIDKKIQQNTANLIEINGGIELAKNYRKTEESVLVKIKKLQDKITEYASEGGGSGDSTMTAGFTKLLYINGLIRLENLRLEAEMASLIRRSFERELKMAADELDASGEEGRGAVDELKNLDEIKK